MCVWARWRRERERRGERREGWREEPDYLGPGDLEFQYQGQASPLSRAMLTCVKDVPPHTHKVLPLPSSLLESSHLLTPSHSSSFSSPLLTTSYFSLLSLPPCLFPLPPYSNLSLLYLFPLLPSPFLILSSLSLSPHLFIISHSSLPTYLFPLPPFSVSSSPTPFSSHFLPFLFCFSHFLSPPLPHTHSLSTLSRNSPLPHLLPHSPPHLASSPTTNICHPYFPTPFIVSPSSSTLSSQHSLPSLTSFQSLPPPSSRHTCPFEKWTRPSSCDQ